MIVRSAFVLACLAVVAAPALAQPDGDVEALRAEAATLQKEGSELVKKKDFAGALAKFRAGYAKFASPKILKNIGSTLAELGRAADAANAYQRWLDDPGADSAQRATVQQALAALDPKVGVVQVGGLPVGTEVQIEPSRPGWLDDAGEPAWLAPAQAARWRVPAGPFTVRARKPGFQPAEYSGKVEAGGKIAVALTLVAEVKQPDPVTPPPDRVGTVEPPPPDVLPDGPEAPAPTTVPVPGLQLGALVDVAIDGGGQGVAVTPGLTARLADRAELAAKALIGGSKGVYLGGSVYLLRGKLRPQLSAGVPIFFSDGARLGVRGGAGLCVDLAARLSAVAEVGAEYFLNPEMDRTDFVIVPVVGVHARL